MKYVCTILALFMVGCVTKSNIRPEDKDISHMVKDLKESTTLGFDPYSLYDPSGKNPGHIKIYGHNSYRRWWCSSDDNIRRTTTKLVQNYCNKIGGAYIDNWCQEIKSEHPLFLAKIGSAGLVGKRDGTRFCTAGADIGVLIISGEKSTDSQSWHNIAKNKFNYTPKRIKRQSAIIKQVNAKIAREKQGEDIISSGVGTKICKKNGNITYVGFIERFENKKIKISVVNAYVGNSRNIQPGDFKQTITWDNPSNWYKCGN